jgi:RNA polymerase sigma-70 factor (ECF subfamily)
MKRIDKQSAVANLDFTGIYNAFYNEILNYVSYKTFGNSDSEDITSEVFAKVYKNLATFDSSKAQFSTWLHWIANNAIIDYYRLNKYNSKNVNVSEYVDSDGNELFQIKADNDSAESIESSELKNSISKAFASLKPNYQKIATLFFLEEKKYDEIAEICNIPMGSVKGMISRCRAMLQSELQSKRVEYCLA